MYENNQQIFKFKVDENGLQINISHEDIKWLVEWSPDNTYRGLGKVIEPIEGRELELAKWFIKGLMDDNGQDSNDTVLGSAFEKVLDGALSGYENNVFKYIEYEED